MASASKHEFVGRVAQKAGLSQRDAGKAVDAFLDSITDALKRGESVTFTGFGKFSTAHREAPEGVSLLDPSHKAHIPAANVPRFSAGSALKNAVKGGGGRGSPVLASDPERVRRAVHQLDDGTLLPSVGSQLERALEGSHEATREYVRSVRTLALRVLGEAHRLRPDIVIRTEEGQFAVVDLKGAARKAPVEALETASAEAPFGPWTGRFPLEEAVALDLASRVRQLIGLRGLDPAPGDAGVGTAIDDLAAERFLRRVRFFLNHPDDEHPLRRLMDAFALSKTELGSLFGVRRQAVDQWLDRGVPAERQEKVQTLLAIVDLLERKLKPGRLPGIARRPADSYGGKTMLELIARDKHRELLEQVRDSFDWASAA